VFAHSLGDCDPLVTEACWLPYPNNFWLRQNAQGELTLAFSNASLPLDIQRVPIDPVVGGWNALDGFAPASPIITFFNDLDLDRVPSYWNMGMSLQPNCASILLNAGTGELIEHWCELDVNSDLNKPPVTRPLVCYPGKRLDDSSRYIMAFRYLTTINGQLVQPSAAFQALRDNTTSTDPNVNERRPLFENIFSILGAHGVARSSLILAWDFSTMSTTSASGALLHMQADATERVTQAGGVNWKVQNVDDNFSENIQKKLTVQIEVPQYVDRSDSTRPEAVCCLELLL